MSTNEKPRSHILITEQMEEAFSDIKTAAHPNRVVGFIKDDFLIEDAKAAIAEAYISEDETKYIVLGAKSFNTVSQNALLKALEEPPRNIEFILIAPSKSAFLPTIRSRLPMKKLKSAHTIDEVDIRLRTLDLNALFTFVKAHERLKKHEAKSLIEALYNQAVVNESMTLDARQLEVFERAYRLIELNARMQSVLIGVLMTFLPKKRRHAG